MQRAVITETTGSFTSDSSYPTSGTRGETVQHTVAKPYICPPRQASNDGKSLQFIAMHRLIHRQSSMLDGVILGRAPRDAPAMCDLDSTS